ncbi:MAG TPA: GTPase ObgE [Oscillospiraceae bacterium]|nr:GTPase ObgE [Oscillospiraceae bacterium]HPF57083.1 GTPase ObgE [Clostridiales bacterium]HPK34931.1 GTPase ObgE [Oscillospiraceae bacterium]HPR75360.1 GTPase ObgE [Oscillospiraceae bacterium]
MFIDTAKVLLKAGNGGNGAVTFHREKYIANGGPDGGDGGKGGDILLCGNTHLTTLADFRYKRKYAAPDGAKGDGGCRAGRKGEDIVIALPIGTVIKDAETGRIIADISSEKPVIIAKGGSGGAGNRHFATATRQCPRFAKAGAPGEEREVLFELKLLADVGLVGFPNAGKSTLISAISNARPEIADYPFTTLRPNLGVVYGDSENSFVMADIPGIIEGAAEGVGLGHEFLRHIERCRLLLQVVDVASTEGRDPKSDFDVICSELERYSPLLASLPRIVAANKTDSAIEEMVDDFCTYVRGRGFEVFPISAVTGVGLKELKYYIFKALPTLPAIKVYEPEPEPELKIENDRPFTVTNNEGVFIIEAPWLIRILNSVNMDDYESLQYFQRVLRQSGIIAELERQGVNEGDTVSIYDFEFEYVR